MKTWQVLLLIVGFSAVQVFTKTISSSLLLPGKPHEFTNPLYPDFEIEGTQEWNFEVYWDAKIKVVCTDIVAVQRSPIWTADCPNVYLGVIEGGKETKICNNSINNFVYKSTRNKLTVKLFSNSDGRGLLKCVATNTGDLPNAELIKLSANGRVKHIKIAEDEPQPHLQKQWIFETTDDTRISCQCDLRLYQMEPVCGSDVIIFNDGEEDDEYCDGQKHVWFSKFNKAKLRLELSKFGEGYLDCVVQAVTGPNANEYANVQASAEVFSETDGVIRGSRNTSCECGRTNSDRARITLGEETQPNEFPWAVYLFINWVVNSTYKAQSACTASIITERHILTAAHCVEHYDVVPPEAVTIYLAKHDETKPPNNEVAIKAKEIFVRDKYLEEGLRYDDIAVIFTEETMDFSSPFIGPICIEPKPYDLLNKRVMVIGWGVTEDFVFPRHLRIGKTRVIDNYFCRGSDWDLCTKASPSGVCSGDSGGPFVILDPETNRYSQVSLTSRTIDEEGECLDRGISTLVSYYYNYIQQVIRVTAPELRTCHKV